MAKQSQKKFMKRQREFERMRKAKEKMARRQGKKENGEETGTPGVPDQPLAEAQTDRNQESIVRPGADGPGGLPGSDQEEKDI